MELDGFSLMEQGAESRLYVGSFLGRDAIVKHRFSKKYRHPALDTRLISEHTKAEVRCLVRCMNAGIPTPTIYYADESYIVLEYLKETSRCRDVVDDLLKTNNHDGLKELASNMGNIIGSLHKNNLVHGDLTTSNILVSPSNGQIYLIDFGLGQQNGSAEDKGVDIYVLERALLSTHPKYTEDLFKVILDAYQSAMGKQAVEVMKKYEEIRLRGRKRSMEG
uniref:non-specific serine/threonine protein kinase n=1 Tax=Caligus clemensi TaxID=344056 RepID=C1C2P1_CALCM|nr:TP53-regulating kinase [Caligus clemensi]